MIDGDEKPRYSFEQDKSILELIDRIEMKQNEYNGGYQ